MGKTGTQQCSCLPRAWTSGSRRGEIILSYGLEFDRRGDSQWDSFVKFLRASGRDTFEARSLRSSYT